MMTKILTTKQLDNQYNNNDVYPNHNTTKIITKVIYSKLLYSQYNINITYMNNDTPNKQFDTYQQ